nr:DUF2971 domain-containing protein [uncultured Sphaerochaeta sp.]
MPSNKYIINGTDNPIATWIKQMLLDGFGDTSRAAKLMEEKIKSFNGKLYQYCAIDSNSKVQNSISNLKESVVYLSNIKDFNDPFDTNITLSIKNLFDYILPHIFQKKVTSPALSLPELQSLLVYWFDVSGKRLVSMSQVKSDMITDKNAKNVYRLLRKFPELEELLNSFSGIVSDSIPQMNKAMQEANSYIQNQALITCFSTKCDDALMWAHYARKHKGFCVEYNFRKTKDTALITNLFPIIYSDNRPSLPLAMFREVLGLPKSPEESNENLADMICTFLTKSSIWSYEDEWRLLFIDRTIIPSVSGNKYPMDCIDKVIMGCRIDIEFERLLNSICQEQSIHLSKMKLDEENFRLSEVQIF